MGARGREAQSEKQVKALGVVHKERPKPPRHLPKVAKALWKSIVDSLPVEHFKTCDLPLLTKYCMCEDIYWRALKLMDESMVITTEKGYLLPDTYLTIANKQVQLQTALATKLRIATNARVSKFKAAHEKEEPKRSRRGLMFGGQGK